MFTFRFKYFVLTFLVFIVELYIAIYINDIFIRPYGGDILAIIFVYYLLKTFLNFEDITLAFVSLLIAYLVELLQYLNVLYFFRLHNIYILKIVLGTSFSGIDILCYTVGFLLILLGILQKKK